MDIAPVSTVIVGGNGKSVPSVRSFSLTGSPIPEKVYSMIRDSFGKITNEDAEALHQFLLHKSPSSDIDDIKITLHKILSGEKLPSKEEIVNQIKHQLTDELMNKSLDNIVDFQKDLLVKEMEEMQNRAKETGDWRFFLRAVQKKGALNAIGDTEQ